MGFAYNYGLLTPMKGVAVTALKLTVLDVATGSNVTIAEDGNAGMVASVEHDATGVYIFQMAAPYPVSMIACIPMISNADGTTDLRFATYDSATYSATTGLFTVNVSNDDDSGAPVLADPAATDEMHVILFFGLKTNI